MPDYYQILEVTPNSSIDEIKKSFRKLAHQYHPDKSNGNENKFKEVNEAYQVLSNKEKRTQYDRLRDAFKNNTYSPPSQPYYTTQNVPKQRDWKNVIITGAVILFFAWSIFSDSNDTSTSSSNNVYTSPTQNSVVPSVKSAYPDDVVLPVNNAVQNSNDDTVIRGQYRCSSYEASKVDALTPTDNESSIAILENSVEQQSAYLDSLENEINNSYVNEYSSQYEIDVYNGKVDQYNSKLSSYKRDLANYNSKIDRFNMQVDTYNNYLENHCTKIY